MSARSLFGGAGAAMCRAAPPSRAVAPVAHRAIRFATRLGFRFDDALLRAMLEPDVKDALAHKVSRQRLGSEFIGMLQGSPRTRGCAVRWR